MNARTLLPSLLLLLLSAAAAQTYRVTGTAEVEIDGVAWRFHAFVVTDDGDATSTAIWENDRADGVWFVDVVLVEPDVGVETPYGEAFALLSFGFFVDPETGSAVSTPVFTPDLIFVPDNEAFWPYYEALAEELRIAVTTLERVGDLLRVSGTLEAVLGLVASSAELEPDPDDTVTLAGTFELHEVVYLEH